MEKKNEKFYNQSLNQFSFYLPQVMEAVRAVSKAGWSCTPQVKSIPASKDCFSGRKKHTEAVDLPAAVAHQLETLGLARHGAHQPIG